MNNFERYELDKEYWAASFGDKIYNRYIWLRDLVEYVKNINKVHAKFRPVITQYIKNWQEEGKLK
jgi:hypothetical protein